MERVAEMIHLSWAHQKMLFGEGVGVAVMDTGIASHIDFDKRIVGFCDMVGQKNRYYDDHGHGCHVAGR